VSIYSEADRERAHELAQHVGHRVVVTLYPNAEVCVECEDCHEVLIHFLADEPGLT
jgi:hypothetical protein